MEKKKNIIIFILSVIIVILSVFIVLFAMNVISFSDNNDVVDNKLDINNVLEQLNGVWGSGDYMISIKNENKEYLQGMYGTDGFIGGSIKNIKRISDNKFELEIFVKGCTGNDCMEEKEDEIKTVVIEIDNTKNVIINNGNEYNFITNEHSDKNIIDLFFNHNSNISNKITLNNEVVDEKIFSELLNIIGVSIDNRNMSNCLNVALSNKNYKDNAYDIFSWYVFNNNLNTHHYNDEKCQLSDECTRAYSCGGCMSILKKDVDEIIRKYDLNNNDIDIFNEMPEYADEYHYTSSACCGAVCAFYIEHNITTEIINLSDVRIVDIQKVDEYKWDDELSDYNIKNSKNQTVTYDFVKDSYGNYYLSNVDVK